MQSSRALQPIVEKYFLFNRLNAQKVQALRQLR
jgi:hypothetical protein